MTKGRVTSLGFTVSPEGFGANIGGEYVESDRDVVRRVLNRLGDKRVLYRNFHNENAEHSRLAARDIRDLMTQEIENVSEGGKVEASFTRIRQACRDFDDAAGDNSAFFIADQTHYYDSLHVMREAVNREVATLSFDFKIAVEVDLLQVLPAQDLSWVPGF